MNGFTSNFAISKSGGYAELVTILSFPHSRVVLTCLKTLLLPLVLITIQKVSVANFDVSSAVSIVKDLEETSNEYKRDLNYVAVFCYASILTN